ncbi:MAG: DUF2298 domain-containing protein [Chloroflexota bacterium]
MAEALLWLVALEATSIATLPLLTRVFGAIPLLAACVGRSFALMVVGYLAWLLAMLGVLGYSSVSTAVLTGAIGLVTWAALGREALVWLRAQRAALALGVAAFYVPFVLGVVVRAYNADVIGQEKFMDMALFNALLTAQSLPAEDPWLAGFGMPYYYLGYLVLGIPSKLAGTTPAVGYNLALTWVFAAGFAGACGVASSLVDGAGRGHARARALTTGALGGTLVMIAGNLEAVFELVAARGLGSTAFWQAVAIKGLPAPPSPDLLPSDGSWWWRASRVIANIQPDGITEFPYFSFILGDLHPHFTALPLLMTVLAVARVGLERRFALGAIDRLSVAGLLGMVVGYNTWDLPLTWGIFTLAELSHTALVSTDIRSFIRNLRGLGMTLVAAPLMMLPYFVGYESQSLSLGLVREPTPFVSYLILFGPSTALAVIWRVWQRTSQPASGRWRQTLTPETVIVAATALGLVWRGYPTLALLIVVLALTIRLAWRIATSGEEDNAADKAIGPRAATAALMVVAFGILAGVELIYLHDSFGSRMNTVFKFHYNAWALLGIASAAAVGGLAGIDSSGRRLQMLGAPVVALLLVGGLVYPVGATWTKSGGFQGRPTLDGARFLREQNPGDYAAIEWLRRNTEGRPVVVEAAGNDYEEFARVSTFSGLPTVIGWIGHELQWRGTRHDYPRRQRDVDEMYRAAALPDLLDRARPYNARYMFFGSLERARYGPSVERTLTRFLPIAFIRDGTVIFEIPRAERGS